MKRILMIGDIGWSRFYHLGDEAMTEFALDALHARADVEVTLIAGEPEHAGEMYGVSAISRIGFRRNRPPNIVRMTNVLRYAETGGSEGGLDPEDPAIGVIEAVKNADAVLIAGGGNLNSMFAHHIYERATVAKLATMFGKPYALTSQTLGPLIYDEDRPLVHDLLAGAEFVGTRESYTTKLAGDLGAGDAAIRRQVDDAFSLAARDEDRAAVADLVSEPFILASFAEKASSPMISDKQYHSRLVELCTRLVDETGLRVLLVPHGGALPPEEETRDQITNAQIASATGTEAVQPVRMLTARELIALTERAEFVIGTRYHAGIFAGAAAVPFISLSPNLYSAIRMRGAAENVGMTDFVLPLDSVDDIVATAVGVARDRDALQEVLRSQAEARLAEHREWWDFVVANTIGLREDLQPGADVRQSGEAADRQSPGFFHAEEHPNSYIANIALSRERLSALADYGLVLAKKDRRLALAREEAAVATRRLEVLERRSDRQANSRVFRAARAAQKVSRRVRLTARGAIARSPFGSR
ncbi:polysaccharide pyruvyl transferase family protein [Brevibacterium sp. ZH18]|uniref:polysaccharide pyruvyl transferase family protein n=1 Tax=Brevibacterium sp. ZH18 TaxID=2927784 RepID=UPI001F61384A|nr:polysaccharide pyruvyl transferase family protein [Brevibacterium sp. ZH18]MCI4012449.1 polysaccharide pyruvyl transferase family protein [Brevibacterium sp. ZH18]